MIRILCRKIPKRGVDFPRLINQLSEQVQSQPGFIRSESFWDSRGDITSMSDYKYEIVKENISGYYDTQNEEVIGYKKIENDGFVFCESSESEYEPSESDL
jgi:hypothetical protein